MNFKKIIESKEYDFIRTNPILKDNILFLTISGSYSYGTNINTSDIDIRGVVLDRKSDLLGLTNFEQYFDPETDTVIYSLKKFLKLAKDCNPNIIEMLFCNKEHYLYISPLGKMILDNKHLFLTTKAIYSFTGYANAQLNRLENALCRDVLKEEEKLRHINRSIENVINSFDSKYNLPKDSIKTYVGQSNEGSNLELLVDFNLKKYPLSNLKSEINEMTNVLRDYNNTVGQRNKKKDDIHLNKHMMHLIKLYLMCNEILEYNDLHTYRKEHVLLMDIRNGKYRDENGYLKKEFHDLLNELQNKFELLKKTTKLKEFNEKEYIKFVLKLYEEAFKWK